MKCSRHKKLFHADRKQVLVREDDSRVELGSVFGFYQGAGIRFGLFIPAKVFENDKAIFRFLARIVYQPALKPAVVLKAEFRLLRGVRFVFPPANQAVYRL